MEEGATIACPYCMQELWVAVDASGGNHQRFVTDCEVCCRPIHCRATVEPPDVYIDAASEDDAT